MLYNIQYNVSRQCHVNLSECIKLIVANYSNVKKVDTHVVPWHPGGLQDRNRIAHELVDLLEIKHTGIIVILTRE